MINPAINKKSPITSPHGIVLSLQIPENIKTCSIVTIIISLYRKSDRLICLSDKYYLTVETPILFCYSVGK